MLHGHRGGQNLHQQVPRLKNTNTKTKITQQIWVCHIIVEWTLRWRQGPAGHHCCSVERKVQKWVHWDIIVWVSTAGLASLCWWGHVLDVVDCWAVECDDSTSQRLICHLCCQLTSTEASWRQWMYVTSHRSRLLHSPTRTSTHTDVVNYCC